MNGSNVQKSSNVTVSHTSARGGGYDATNGSRDKKGSKVIKGYDAPEAPPPPTLPFPGMGGSRVSHKASKVLYNSLDLLHLGNNRY